MGAAVEDSITFSVYHAAVRYFGRARGGDGSGGGGVGGRARPEDLPLSRVFLAGSMGGMTTSFIVTPLELIKCRLQVDRVSKEGMGGSVARYKGPIDCLLQSVRQEGLRVLYRGHSATFLRESLGTGVFFSTYEMGLRTLAAGIPREEVPAPAVLLAGAMAGVVLNAVPYPLDTAKSVMQTLQAPVGAGEAGAAVVPRSLWGAVKLIVEAEGVAGLYRGITPALLRAMPSNAVVFLSVSWVRWGGGRGKGAAVVLHSHTIKLLTLTNAHSLSRAHHHYLFSHLHLARTHYLYHVFFCSMKR
jgi:hypothetical protein